MLHVVQWAVGHAPDSAIVNRRRRIGSTKRLFRLASQPDLDEVREALAAIIADHGGQLRGTPNPDRGATFHLTLPGA